VLPHGGFYREALLVEEGIPEETKSKEIQTVRYRYIKGTV